MIIGMTPLFAQRTSWYPATMTETMTQSDRDAKTGQFVTGSKGGPGRRPGSKNRITEEFLRMFAADVHEHGADVIERVRIEKPEIYLRVWADLLPRKTELDVNIDILGDVSNALEAFRVAADLLGADPKAGMRRLRKIAPQLEYYDADGE
jgi:hypothetical protein